MQVRDVCASQAVARELAMVLGRRPSDLPRIRKTEEVPPRYAITDAIMVVKGCSAKDARVELTRLRERYGDRATNCSSVRFRDSRSRIGANATPVAKTDALLEVVLLLTGSKAAAVRKHVVQVFVKYLGGDPGLAEQVLANRQAQEHLAATEPGHPAHAFGEAVEAAAGVNAGPHEPRMIEPGPSRTLLTTLMPGFSATLAPEVLNVVEASAVVSFKGSSASSDPMVGMEISWSYEVSSLSTPLTTGASSWGIKASRPSSISSAISSSKKSMSQSNTDTRPSWRSTVQSLISTST